MEECAREMTRQELVDENNKLRNEIKCKSKAIDEYYREKNDYQCKMIAMQKHIECLQEELKQPLNVYDVQSHFIYENELLTTVHILSGELAKLRRQKGLLNGNRKNKTACKFNKRQHSEMWSELQ